MGKRFSPKSRFLSSLTLLCLLTSVARGIEIGGPQAGVWTIQESPYIVTSDIIVPQGMTLKIEPGVVVKFDGYYGITIKGTLIAEGLLGKRIIFTSIHDKEFGNSERQTTILPTNKDWKGLEFTAESGQTSKLDVCIIRYSDQAIAAEFADPSLTRIFLVDCSTTSFKVNGRTITVQDGTEIDYNIVQTPFIQNPVPTTTPPAVLPQQTQAPTTVLTHTSNQDVQSLFAEEEFTFGEITIISASKFIEKLSDAPGVISVLSKDELERFGGTTLKDILERVPSLTGSTVYMTDRSIIASRGDQIMASSSHVLLLINGRPVREVLEGGIKSEIYESFPVNIIERIEVIRGPGSVLYGSNAFSAVINIITEEATENNFSITGLAGESDAYGTLGKVQLKSGDVSVVATARYMEKAEWETDFSYGNYFSPTDTTITINTTIPNKGVGTYIGIGFKNLRFMGSHNEWKHSYFIADYATIIPIPTYGTNKWTKSFADLGYNLAINDQWDMDFNVTYSRSTFKVDSWPSTNRDSYEIVAEWSNAYRPTESMTIVFGGLYNYNAGKEWGPLGDIAKFTFTNADRYSVGAYTQLNYKLIQNLNVIAGLQTNKVEKIDLDVVPRLGVIWYPGERINVKALYSQAFRAPSLNELNINFPEMQGNPDLIPEKVSTIDFGINYQGDQFQTGVNFFHSKQKDVIFQNRDTTVVPAPMYWNGVEVEFTGIEFESKYYMNRNIFLTGSMLYQTNKNKEGDENVTPIANLGVKAGISYISEKGVTVGLFNVYQADLDNKFDTQLNPSPKAYNLMNLHCKLNMNKNVNVVFQIDNLLDKEIWLPDWGLLPGKSMPVNLGRAFYFGIDTKL